MNSLSSVPIYDNQIFKENNIMNNYNTYNTIDFLDATYHHQKNARNPSKQYTLDNVFAAYVDLCYGESAKYKAIPQYRMSNAPLGMDFSNLRLCYNKFYQSAYVLDKKPLCRKLLTQLAESLSQVEVRFLREVLKGKISFYTKEQYAKDKSALDFS